MIRTAIVGYGNLGKGAEAAIAAAPDMKLTAVFTRRNPDTLEIRTTGVPVYSYSELAEKAAEIDVVILCGGSATDLPWMTPEVAKCCTVVDSFDTHAHIPEHFAAVDAAAKEGGNIAVISTGWDPGLFSIARLYANIALPDGADYTFWGRGVSQGHSDAIRRIPGVRDARQYTVPVAEAVERVRNGENPVLTTREKHLRECWVVPEEDADIEAIREAIVTMPNYFDEYDTTVNFITEEELLRDHAGLPHGGSVIRSGATGWEGEYKDTIEFSLKLDSNPFFTGSVLAACARAAYRMKEKGETGCRTLFDIPPALLSEKSPEELRAHLL
ncbi:MAG: diaminopimelate dehydrogenase [Lachnospiraceae bacterium]|nr:diaminopimelate dehydrogenase [Lachnospiraceae bacterium]